MTGKTRPRFVLPLLGTLSVVSPFAIDMYLSAFQELAGAFDVPSTTVAWTLSSYFVGLSVGQVVYGPLLDRFGRKRPLLGGLALFVAASIGCVFAPDVYVLIALRFVQAFGGCVAQVASVAMVRDFYPRSEAARVLSRLFLFIAVSPLLAPTVGGLVIEAGGWRAAFVALAGVVAVIWFVVLVRLPEGLAPDASISLRPGPILAEYFAILKHPRFATYALAGAFSFAGLFTFVAGSPIIFMDGFGLGPLAYSLVFALLAGGFIGGSQVNVGLLRYWSSETLFRRVLVAQVAIGALFLTCAVSGACGLVATLVLLFLFLFCVGITNPNASALAIAPFTRNAGSASALLGFFQLGVGAVISTGIGMSTPQNSVPIVAILAATAATGLTILLIGWRRAEASSISECPVPVTPDGRESAAEGDEPAPATADGGSPVVVAQGAAPCCPCPSGR